jgi:hypothetical protein
MVAMSIASDSRIPLALLALGLMIAPVMAAERRARDRSPARDTECITPDVVLYQQMSGLWTPTTKIVDNEAQWCELWDQIHDWILPAPECDRTLIDFDTHAGVVVGLGSRPNLCYSLALPLVCESPKASGHLRVTVVEGVPGASCMCAMALVQPLAVIAVERSVESVSLKRRLQVYDCEQPDGIGP